MRRKSITWATILVFTGQFFVTPARATESLDEPPPPPPAEEVVIDSVTTHGSGCLPGTTSVALKADSVALLVTYGDYVAKVGVGAALTDFRKHCQVSVLVRVPEGYTYGITRVEHSGYASLAAGATAQQRASHYFQGSPNTMRTHPFASPFDDIWHVADEPDIPEIEFLPCGELRNFIISTELRVNVGASDPTTTTSLLSMSFSDTYRFHWNRCPAAP